jgi:hypothetical protein
VAAELAAHRAQHLAGELAQPPGLESLGLAEVRSSCDQTQN